MTNHHDTLDRSRRARLARLTLSLLGAVAFLAAPSVTAQPTYCESDGLIVLQIENANPASGWSEETSLAEYTGESYFRWTGGNQFFNPGLGVVTYVLNVTNPGVYNMRIRNWHQSITEQNDLWARMDGGGWQKTYSSLTGWNWSTRFESTNDPAEYFLTAGQHVFQISGRSQDFIIDRIHFYQDGVAPPLALFYDEDYCMGSWTNLGNGLAGTGNVTPTLSGEGALNYGTTTTISLDDARPNTLATLVLGVSQVNVSFKGGVMVPSPDFFIAGLPTGPAGALSFDFDWSESAPSGVSLYWQYWIADPGAPVGFSASNGLRSTTP